MTYGFSEFSPGLVGPKAEMSWQKTIAEENLLNPWKPRNRKKAKEGRGTPLVTPLPHIPLPPNISAMNSIY